MIISTSDKYIHYVSPCWVGKSHDFCILKEEFAPQEAWFKNHEVQLDLGFAGFDKNYECECVGIPHKKSKGKELDEQQKLENKSVSRERIVVEHSIGGMKRYRILSDRARMHDFNLYDDILGVIAGL